MVRPSHKGLSKKIKKAKEAVLGNRIAFVDPSVIAADALEIGCLVEDILDVLVEILDEISPSNYVGTSRPQRSYEAKIDGCELFCFRWESTRLGCEIYPKFAFEDDLMWLVSFHQHRETKGG